jgi:murein DD-endopeptidase MepM/ murein hydrolase activator NlpD
MRIYKMRNILLLFFLITFWSCSDTSENEKEVVEITPEVINNPVFLYGLNVDKFLVDSGLVKPNQGLTHILPKYGIGQATIYKIADEFDSIFDVRKIKPDHPYYVFCSKDSNKTTKCFIYEKNAIEYVVFNFEDSLNVSVFEKEVLVVEELAGGVITSSLWNAFIDNDLSPGLVMEFSKLFAWSIDFFGIQKGDYFKVMYETKYVEGKKIGDVNVNAVLFNHMGNNHYVFHYESDTAGMGYYTEKGESMKRALLSAPLEYSRISSKFSHRRFHPVYKYYRPHHGVDYAAPIGTEVVATGSGKVIYAGWAGDAGRLVKIQHTTGDMVTKYMHLSKFGPGIKKGATVMQGQKIGEVGSTGASTGPHLDYRIFIHGKAVDPLKIDIPSSDPLENSALVEYLEYIAPRRLELDGIEAKKTPAQQVDEE